MAKKITVFEKPLAGQVPFTGLKCLMVTDSRKLDVVVDLPSEISAAMERGDKIHDAMAKAVGADCAAFIQSAHTLQKNGDKMLLDQTDQAVRERVVGRII